MCRWKQYAPPPRNKVVRPDLRPPGYKAEPSRGVISSSLDQLVRPSWRSRLVDRGLRRLASSSVVGSADAWTAVEAEPASSPEPIVRLRASFLSRPPGVVLGRVRAVVLATRPLCPAPPWLGRSGGFARRRASVFLRRPARRRPGLRPLGGSPVARLGSGLNFTLPPALAAR